MYARSSTSVIQSGNPDRPKPGCDGASRRACWESLAAYRWAGSKPSQPCRNSIGAPAPDSNISSVAPAMAIVELRTPPPVPVPRLLGGPAIPTVAACHGSQAEVFPQGPAFVLAAKQPAALQFGNDHVDEILSPAGQGGRRDVEAIAGRCFEPLLHGVGDVGGRADPRGAGDPGAEVQFAYRGLLSSHPLDELSAHAAQLLAAQCAVGHRLVQCIARQVTERAVERAEAGQRVEQRLQLVVLRLRFGARSADDWTKRRHDLEIVRLAAVFRHPPFDVGVVGARALSRAGYRVDDVGGGGAQLAPLFRSAGLHDHRMALWHARDIERTAHLEEPALVIQHMHPRFVEIAASRLVEQKGAIVPAVPQSLDHLDELGGTGVTRVV